MWYCEGEKGLDNGKQMAECMVNDKWGLYWHMIPKMCEGLRVEGQERVGLSEEDVERLRKEMLHDMRDEEGKYQIFSVTVGRKPGG